MQIRNLSLLSIFMLACFGQVLAQPPVPTPTATDAQNSIAEVQTDFTCEAANAIKFNQTEYLKLDKGLRVVLDARWASCQPPTDSEDPEEEDIPVIVVNPAPTSKDERVAYGLVKRKTLTEARKVCSTAGMVGGAAVTVAGIATGNPKAAKIGSAVFTYADVACASLEKNFARGNVLLALGPHTIVGFAVANKMAKDAIDNIPVLSGADKENVKKFVDRATSPPSVTVGEKNIDITAGGVKVSVPKPKVKIKKPRITL